MELLQVLRIAEENVELKHKIDRLEVRNRQLEDQSTHHHTVEEGLRGRVREMDAEAEEQQRMLRDQWTEIDKLRTTVNRKDREVLHEQQCIEDILHALGYPLKRDNDRWMQQVTGWCRAVAEELADFRRNHTESGGCYAAMPKLRAEVEDLKVRKKEQDKEITKLWQAIDRIFDAAGYTGGRNNINWLENAELFFQFVKGQLDRPTHPPDGAIDYLAMIRERDVKIAELRDGHDAEIERLQALVRDWESAHQGQKERAEHIIGAANDILQAVRCPFGVGAIMWETRARDFCTRICQELDNYKLTTKDVVSGFDSNSEIERLRGENEILRNQKQEMFQRAKQHHQDMNQLKGELKRSADLSAERLAEIDQLEVDCRSWRDKCETRESQIEALMEEVESLERAREPQFVGPDTWVGSVPGDTYRFVWCVEHGVLPIQVFPSRKWYLLDIETKRMLGRDACDPRQAVDQYGYPRVSATKTPINEVRS